ncbi:MAG: hypothetical protein NXY57DRAFT_971917 [Lentinula lateritia]|uniref:Hypervirulence associated protein TUDOR domain-containing protein n=1 Tax=Lentinula lateritia TaxID=40482 RepID=A0ABQ8V4C9_9AGAR|nr:MAG: hypothetical protein NXY57DRAFT_971917 [Lentinula lateritia]KAJ4472630.1 hypothetical protein C8R41DRAFT_924296 [Lentinula lateritia]
MSSHRNHTQTYEAGDHVQYQAIGGGKGTTSTTEGEIQEVITHKRPAGDTGVKVNFYSPTSIQATPEDPRYVIRNDNASAPSTGKETAYKEQNINGVTE